MKSIRISDITMQSAEKSGGHRLSFREKLELAKLLDKLCLSVIETEPIVSRRTDSLLIKSLAAAVKNSILCVPVTPTDPESPAVTWSALSEAPKPRLQVPVCVSIVQMEYFYGKKPAVVLDMIGQCVSACRSLCEDVEFLAQDAGRADPAFLTQAISAAVEAGASTVTVCDTAGTMLPDECFRAVQSLRRELPAHVQLGVSCSNAMWTAESCSVAAIQAGCDEVKTVACGDDFTALSKLVQILRMRGDDLDACCSLRTTELERTMTQIEWLCKTNRTKSSAFDIGVQAETDEALILTANDSRDAVSSVLDHMGYSLSPEDLDRVYAAFISIASKKERVRSKELDAIVASAAMQVPASYELDSYVINASNLITSTAHIRLRRNGELLQGLCGGDGPVDAAFLAIEQIVGCHYELDDFQIRAVTEGREAMGETVVRLRAHGVVYSGRGISTDIVGSSILAYVNALNKIVYEEEAQ